MEEGIEYQKTYLCCGCGISDEQSEKMIIINNSKKIYMCDKCVKLAYENLFGKNEPIKIDLEPMVTDEEISNCGC